jgi:ParB family chromosome partitioning protein
MEARLRQHHAAVGHHRLGDHGRHFTARERDLQRIEQELSDALAAPVEIRLKKRTARGEQGEVAIRFGSLDELNGLLEKLGLPPR